MEVMWHEPGVEQMTWIPQRVIAIMWNAAKDKECGAKTRDGSVCKLPPLWPLSNRCQLHGGLSTGPKTAEGKERVARAQRKRWAAWRAERDLTPPSPRKPQLSTPSPASGLSEEEVRVCPDPRGLHLTEYGGGRYGITSEIWEHGNKRHRLARAKAVLKNLSQNDWRCMWCGEEVPIYRRADARFCRERCRKASARARKNAFQ